jgi:hypothetical protein
MPVRGRSASALLAFSILATTTTACASDASLPDTSDTPGQATVDASSTTAFTYLSLGSDVPVPVTAPATDNSWDLAVRRYEVRLNGGVAGGKGVTAALVVDNSTRDTTTLLGYTAASQQAAFDGVTAASIASAAFTTTSLAPDYSSWFTPSGATLVANPDVAWKVRRADGGFAVMRVAALTITGDALTSFTLEYRLQASVATALGAVQRVTVTPGPPGTPTPISLVNGATMTTTGCTWDVGISAALEFTVNAACSAGTFPLEPTESFAAITNAADAPAYGAFVATISGPIPNSIDAAAKPPFLYDIDPQNPHRLTPTFNVYLVRSGSAVYKLQFLSYYNPVGGASGFITYRLAKLQ